MHEKYLETIKEAMQRYLDNPRVEGLLFHYKLFYGSYDYVADARRRYRREIRVIKKIETIYFLIKI